MIVGVYRLKKHRYLFHAKGIVSSAAGCAE